MLLIAHWWLGRRHLRTGDTGTRYDVDHAIGGINREDSISALVASPPFPAEPWTPFPPTIRVHGPSREPPPVCYRSER